ncbi:MAG: hypothetical protein ACXVB6_18540, partial [Mucilaginibacter sp.]
MMKNKAWAIGGGGNIPIRKSRLHIPLSCILQTAFPNPLKEVVRSLSTTFLSPRFLLLITYSPA